MKTTIELTFVIIIVLISLVSCDNFLSLAPETELTDATFFQNEEHFEQALNGVYQNLQSIPIHDIYMNEMRSDNTFFTRYAGDRSREINEEGIAQFIDTYVSQPTVDKWPNDYRGIAKANTILSRIEETNFSEEFKNQITGETLFLRAFFYFDLVQYFGGVPLQLEEVKAEEGAFLPRSSVEEVYNQIIDDLTTAIPNLPVASTFPQSGRATQGAVKMLLAYVYMSKPEREYSLAESELLDITNMNYSLLDNYSDIFNPANKNNRESIFEIQYKDGEEGLHSSFIWRFAPKTPNSELITGIPDGITNVNWGGWNVPTEEMINSYEDGDLRLDASISVAQGAEESDLLNIEEIQNITEFSPNPDKDHRYFVSKYWHPPYDVVNRTDENFPYFRYADALLLLAECLVEQNRNSEALTYINQVRERAGLQTLSNVTIEDILKERRAELAFENKRWFDLIRTGQAIDVMTDFGERMVNIHFYIRPEAFNITEERLIYPIPQREMDVNNNLVQNPGY